MASDELRPFTESAYAWRWQDSQYDVLPDSALASVHTVRPERARALAVQLHDLHLWASDLPDRTIDTGDVPDDSVRVALQTIDTDLVQQVITWWGRDDAILLPWATFAEHWSAFCYPSSDDVTIVPLSERWVLSYAHYEKFFWRQQ